MPAAKLVLVGDNGFLGRHVRTYFQRIGYEMVSISRTGPGDVRWDARTLGPWAAELEGADLLVNLAGRSVDCRYTAANRRAVLAEPYREHGGTGRGRGGLSAAAPRVAKLLNRYHLCRHAG